MSSLPFCYALQCISLLISLFSASSLYRQYIDILCDLLILFSAFLCMLWFHPFSSALCGSLLWWGLLHVHEPSHRLLIECLFRRLSLYSSSLKWQKLRFCEFGQSDKSRRMQQWSAAVLSCWGWWLSWWWHCCCCCCCSCCCCYPVGRVSIASECVQVVRSTVRLIPYKLHIVGINNVPECRGTPCMACIKLL